MTSASGSESGNSASTSQASGRVKRQVSDIETAESKRLEKEALKELRRLNREEKILRRSREHSAASNQLPAVPAEVATAEEEDLSASAGQQLEEDSELLTFLALKPEESEDGIFPFWPSP